jgi:hypothetical protein
MAELITVPTFTFDQGDAFSGNDNVERPIQVKYWNGTIELKQNGETVLILPDYLESLFKEIKKHLPHANKALKK